MENSYGTFLVDVLNVADGIPSSGGLRGANGRMLAQYCHPRAYKPYAYSEGLLLGLGVASGIGLVVLGIYGIYKLCSEDTGSSSAYDQTERLWEIKASLDLWEHNSKRLMEQNDASDKPASHEARIHTGSSVTPLYRPSPSAFHLAE